MNEKIYTEVEASEALGITRTTLERHRLAGRIKPKRFGKGWCYTERDLDAWRSEYGAAVARRQAQLFGSARVRT